MTLNPMRSPVLFSGLFAWLVGMAASCLPIWQVTVFYELSGLVRSARQYTLWEVLRWRPTAIGPESNFPGLLQDDVHNLALAFAILACGAGIGRLSYWLLQERGQSLTS